MEAGNEIIDWPVADKPEWQAAVQPAIDRWLAEVERRRHRRPGAARGGDAGGRGAQLAVARRGRHGRDRRVARSSAWRGRCCGLSRAWAVLGGVVLLAVMLMTVRERRHARAARLPDPRRLRAGRDRHRGRGLRVPALLPPGGRQRGWSTSSPSGRPRGSRPGSARSARCSSPIVALALLWRMALGGYDFYHYHEVTTNLGIPRWWALSADPGLARPARAGLAGARARTTSGRRLGRALAERA